MTSKQSLDGGIRGGKQLKKGSIKKNRERSSRMILEASTIIIKEIFVSQEQKNYVISRWLQAIAQQ